MMELLRPNLEMLADYVDALERGWSFDNVRGAEGARDDLEAIRQDAGRFVDSLYDPDALGSPIAFPDGSKLPRLPGYRLWMWDGEFCGSIGLRWQPGTSELPAYVLGHIGYGVVFVERFTKTDHHGGGDSLRYRIDLRPQA